MNELFTKTVQGASAKIDSRRRADEPQVNTKISDSIDKKGEPTPSLPTDPGTFEGQKAFKNGVLIAVWKNGKWQTP